MRSRALLVAALVPALLAMAEGQPGCVGKAEKDGTCAPTTAEQFDADGSGSGTSSEPVELPTQSQKPDTAPETEPAAGSPGRSTEGTTRNDAPVTSQRPQEEVDVLGEFLAPGTATLGAQDRQTRATRARDGAEAPLGSAGPEDGPARPATPPRPPPSGIRYLSTRLLGGGDLEVLVNENQVRGIDAGWAVVVDVDGGRFVPEAVTATGHGGVPRSVLPGQPGQPVTLLAVTGQRSPESYAARYRAIGQLDVDARPVITITLIQ